eukprot:6440041-Prymnesium_polylepis.1
MAVDPAARRVCGERCRLQPRRLLPGAPRHIPGVGGRRVGRSLETAGHGAVSAGRRADGAVDWSRSVHGVVWAHGFRGDAAPAGTGSRADARRARGGRPR